jgi:hypothetical protein
MRGELKKKKEKRVKRRVCAFRVASVALLLLTARQRDTDTEQQRTMREKERD